MGRAAEIATVPVPRAGPGRPVAITCHASPVVVAAALAASLPQAPCTLVETWADCAHCSAPEEQRISLSLFVFI